jgi:hypothetical protein
MATVNEGSFHRLQSDASYLLTRRPRLSPHLYDDVLHLLQENMPWRVGRLLSRTIENVSAATAHGNDSPIMQASELCASVSSTRMDAGATDVRLLCSLQP